METRSFVTGDVIFREGEASAGEAFRVVSGAVEIAIRTPYGPRPVAELHAGELFGEMGLGDDQPRSATATAIEDTALEVITEENFERTILENKERLREYLANLFERLRTTDHLLQMAVKQQPAIGKEAPPPNATHSMESAMVQHLDQGESDPSETATTETNWKVRLDSDFETTGWDGEPIHRILGKFPFRIGRLDPRKESSPFGSNDLAIPDGVPYQISRNHCAIERHGGDFVLRDRGSTVGTVVNGEHVGVHGKVIAARLLPGENTIILGSSESPYRFKLTIEAA